MATIGRTTVGGSTFPFENAIYAGQITMTEDGTATSITAHLGEDGADNAHGYRFGIYNPSTGALIAATDASSSNDLTFTSAWKTLTFPSPPALSNGVSYMLAVWSSGGSGDPVISYDGTGGVSNYDAYDSAGSFPTAPDPVDSNPGTNNFSIYLTYTPSGSSLTVTEGTVTLSGQDVTLTATENTTLAVDVGALTGTGQDIFFQYAFTSADVALALTGQNVALAVSGNQTITVTEATITSSGQDVTLSYTAHTSLTVDQVSLTFTGQDISFLTQQIAIEVGSGALSLSGAAVALLNSMALLYDGEYTLLFEVPASGRTRWTNYIPVKYYSPPNASRLNTTDDNAGEAVITLTSTGSWVEWEDYVPVVVVSDPEAGKWRFDDDGFIPVVEITPI